MAETPNNTSRFERLRERLHELYHGATPRAVRFRYGVIAIDLAIIAFFIAAPVIRDSPSFLIIDYCIAALVAVDLIARYLAYGPFDRWIRRPIIWLDIFVFVTLLFPLQLFNLGFLRILRLWTLLNSEFFWETVGRRYDDTRWEEMIKVTGTLLTFIFVVTGFVYSAFVGEDGVHGYVDALYFTVTALTTTGFGDITLPGTWGKLLTIVIMLTGITLFFRFAQALLKPMKVRFPCPTCGLSRHDPDAVHCKACGEMLNIPNEE